jgi:hypothetical protein
MSEPMVTARVNIPVDLWRRVRAAAMTDDRLNEDVLREALEAWLKARNGGK